MSANALRDNIQEILSPAGITINGSNPWDIRINDNRFYQRVLRDGSLGLGESYMDGWWDSQRLDDFFARILPTDPEEKMRKRWGLLIRIFGDAILHPGRKSRAFQIGERHYDKGNELFRAMLDKRMVYSCAYWKDAADLDAAQEAKLDLICRKINLRAGDRVMDVGCGWGGLVKYAAEKYGAKALGITVSKEQAALGGELCKGLPVEVRLLDYRDINEKFDHIVSVGMFEHVGYRNHRTFMEKAYNCLNDGGLFLLHTIGRDSASTVAVDEWIGKYIFPNSLIPSMKQITTATEGLFVIEDVHNIGYDYDATIMSWVRNFNDNWDSLKGRYDNRFYRMWKYYLLSSAGSFRSRYLQVWQIVLSKKGVPGGYNSVR